MIIISLGKLCNSMIKNLCHFLSIFLVNAQWPHNTNNISVLSSLGEKYTILFALIQNFCC